MDKDIEDLICELINLKDIFIEVDVNCDAGMNKTFKYIATRMAIVAAELEKLMED